MQSENVHLEDEIIAGGYRVVLPGAWRGGLPEHLFPSRLVSGSGCVCHHFPEDWCIDWMSTPELTRENAELIGVLKPKREELYSWAQSTVDREWGIPGVCYSLKWAKTLKKEFFPLDSPVVIVGFGLPLRFQKIFLEVCEADTRPTNKYPSCSKGWEQLLIQGFPMELGGQVLGYEPLVSFAGDMNCSWLCNGLWENIPVPPNAHGLIEDLSIAAKLCEDCNAGKIGAEPGLWLPWQLVNYS